jgi:hypothetical protein
MVALIALNVTFLYSFSWFRWVVTLMIVACVASRASGGIDKFELMLHGDMILNCEGSREMNSKKES